MPGYIITLKRIVAQGIGPLWFWRFARKAFHRLFARKSIHLSVIKNTMGSEVAIVLKVDTTGFHDVQYRYWAKNGEEISLLKDWTMDDTITISNDNDMDQYQEYGAHIKKSKDKDFISQTWVRVPQDK
jgi:hypothetical protein